LFPRQLVRLGMGSGNQRHTVVYAVLQQQRVRRLRYLSFERMDHWIMQRVRRLPNGVHAIGREQ